MYSLEVPGAQTFVTTGGLVVHNCFPKDVKALVATAREHGIEFDLRHPDFERMKSLMKAPVVFDGRNIYSPSKMRELGFTCFSIGRK